MGLVFLNNLAHMQPQHAGCEVYTKPGGGDITSNRKDTLANQKHED